MDSNQVEFLKFKLDFDQIYKKFPSNRRKEFISHFLVQSCESEDLAHLIDLIDLYKTDFVRILPVEIVEKIFSYTEAKDLFECCRVNSKWNEILKTSTNLWFKACKSLTTIHDLKLEKNYKDECRVLLKKINSLKSGVSFKLTSSDQFEINSISFYNDVFAIASNIVKFLKFDKNKNEWIVFKELILECRALRLKFDDQYVVVITFFNTIELYSLESGQLLKKYTGHVAGITTVAYSTELKLLVTGSCDNTVKSWLINENQENQNEAIKTINDMMWPIDVRIKKYLKSSHYLIISLNSDNFIYITFFDFSTKIIKFSDESITLNLNETIHREIIDLTMNFDVKSSLLTIIETSKSKAHNENTNYYYLNSNIYYFDERLVQISDNKLEVIKTNEFKQKLSFFATVENGQHAGNVVTKEDLTIVSFGKRYLIAHDDVNQFFFADLASETGSYKKNSFKLYKLFTVNSHLNLNNRYQFCFDDNQDDDDCSSWLNGINLMNKNNSNFAFAFYALNKSTSFMLNWK